MRTYKTLAPILLFVVLAFPGKVSAEWTMEFSVSVSDPEAEEGRTVTRLEAGVSPSASDGFDNSLDVVAFPGGSIESFFSHVGEADYSGSLQALWRDFRSDSLPQSWGIRIISSQNTDPITLSWSNPPLLPSDFCYAESVTLFDETMRRMVDLNGASSLSFFPTGTTAVPEIRSYLLLAQTRPTNAPRAPTGLVSGYRKKQVFLHWDDLKSSGENLAGYHVWRSSVSGAGFERITSVPLSKSFYRDHEVEEGKNHYYVVTALSLNGCESGFSNETSSVPEKWSGRSGGR